MMLTPSFISLYNSIIQRLMLLLFVLLTTCNTTAESSNKGTIGTAADCCCGDVLAVGDCCGFRFIDDDPNKCELVIDNNCAFAELFSGSGDECPSSGFSCDESITCPSVDSLFSTTTDEPPPNLPSLELGCGYVFETTNAPVDSEESCQATCQTYGIFCNPYDNITICGSMFTDTLDCRGNPSVSCVCGSSSSALDLITLCKTTTPLIPTCQELVDGLGPDPITTSETCRAACAYFNAECIEDADSGTFTCGHMYTQVTLDGTVYPTCFCGPEGQQGTEICGSPCGGGSGSSSSSASVVVLRRKVTCFIMIR